MEIWIDHYYANHLKEGVVLYAPYISAGGYDIKEIQKIDEIADRLVGLQFLFEDSYRNRTGEECGVDLPDQIKRLVKILCLTSTRNRQLLIPNKANFPISSETCLKHLNYLMENASSVDYDEAYQTGFIDLYGAREERCGDSYQQYGKYVKKLAGANLQKLNDEIKKMVDNAIKLEKSNM